MHLSNLVNAVAYLRNSAVIMCSLTCNFDAETNVFYDRVHQPYEYALLTRFYSQNALSFKIDCKIDRTDHLIRIKFVNPLTH